MYNYRRLVATFVACMLVLGLRAPRSASARELEVVPGDQVEKIAQALPEKASAKPAKPRSILVFWRCEGFFHGSIPWCNKALELMGEKTGAFSVVTSEDMDMFSPENLNKFDAVLFNNTTGLKFDDPKHRKALMDFAKSDKGVIGIHGASDNFPTWPEAVEMMGGQFDGHPWGGGGTWAFKLDEPDHPINKGFGGKGFLVKDEIYQIKGPYSRDTHRVLVTLDMSDPRNLKVNGINRKDNDHAISWLRRFGEGRVFYCSFGHNNEIFWNAAILQHYLDGIQYALGDYDVADKPSNALANKSAPVQATDGASLSPQFSKLLDYDFGKEIEPLTEVENLVRDAKTDKEKREIEMYLVANLTASQSSYGAKQFICRMLRRIGGVYSVPALGELLADKEMSGMARYALQEMDCPEAGEALRAAMKNEKIKGDLLIGVMSSLGARSDREAVELIAARLADDDEAVARGAILALGRVGNPAAAKALTDAEVSSSLKTSRAAALLMCADRLLARKRDKNAAAIFQALAEAPVETRSEAIAQVAAYRGLIRSGQGDPAATIVALLKKDNADLKRAAGGFLIEMPADVSAAPIAEELAGLDADAQVVLLSALGERGDKATKAQVALAVTKGKNEAARVAAIDAMASLGDSGDVSLLAEQTLAGGAVGNAAVAALNRLAGPNVDKTIIAGFQNEKDARLRATLIQTSVERQCAAAVPALLETATDDDASIRSESFKALGSLAGPKELNALVKLLVAAPSDDDVKTAEKAVASVGNKAEAKDLVDSLQGAMANAKPASQAAIVRLLARPAGRKALETVTDALKNDDKDVRETAVRTLSNWTDAAPMDTLLKLAKDDGQGEYQRLQALRGFIRMTAMPSKRSAEENLAQYATAIEVALRAEDKKLAIEAAEKVGGVEALDFLEKYIDEKDVAKSARDAYCAVFNAASSDVIPTKGWKMNASHGADAVKNAIDGNRDSRWSTNGSMAPGMWFTIDMGSSKKVARLVLDAAGSQNDYPRGYAVYVSQDGTNWGDPVAEGKGTTTVTDIALKTAKDARCIKIIQTGSFGLHWSIHDLKAYGPKLTGELKHAAEVMKKIEQ